MENLCENIYVLHLGAVRDVVYNFSMVSPDNYNFSIRKSHRTNKFTHLCVRIIEARERSAENLTNFCREVREVLQRSS